MIESLKGSLPKNIDSLILAGELYVQNNKRERVGDVAKAISEKDINILSFAIFDLVKIEGKTLPLNYEKRLDELQIIFKTKKNNLKVVETSKFNDKNSIKDFYEKCVNQENSEGIIARTSTEITYKIKPSISLDALVIGFTNKVNEPEKVRSILLGLKRRMNTVARLLR